MDPREVEHPLTPLGDLDVVRLAWIQPQMMHPAYELWGGEKVVATLRFRDINRRTALAASTDAVYTLTGSAAEAEDFTMEAGGGVIAEYRRGLHKDGALFIGEEQAFAWIPRSHWDRVFAFADQRGQEVMRFEAAASDSCRTMITIEPSVCANPNATLLAIAGQYLILGATRQGPRTPKRTVST